MCISFPAQRSRTGRLPAEARSEAGGAEAAEAERQLGGLGGQRADAARFFKVCFARITKLGIHLVRSCPEDLNSCEEERIGQVQGHLKNQSPPTAKIISVSSFVAEMRETSRKKRREGRREGLKKPIGKQEGGGGRPNEDQGGVENDIKR